MYKNAKGMKKSLFILIGVLTSLTVFSQENIYVDSVTNLKYQYYLDANDNNAPKAKLVDGRSVSATKVIIHKEFKAPSIENPGDSITYKVTSIGEKAFATYDNNNKKYTGNTSIEYVIIQEGVTTIEANAFLNCSNLKLLELPSTFTTIVTNAFYGCSSLAYVCCKNIDANIGIPSSLPNNDLMTLFVPEESNNESGYLNPNYSWKNKFGDRIYGGGMEIVPARGDDLVFVCATGAGKEASLISGKRASEITVDSTFIGEDNVKYHVKSIGKSAFYGFTEINSLVIDEGITAIGNSAFYNCSNIQKLTLPSTLNTIGKEAFLNCNNLRHVWCKVADATKHDATRFPNKGMMTLYVPADNISDYIEKGQWNIQFNGRIFKGDMVSATDSYGNEYVCSKGSKVATLYLGMNEAEMSIPSKVKDKDDGTIEYAVTGIDRNAFYGRSSIREVIIPSSVTAIGAYAFGNCNSLAIVHCNSANSFDVEENVFSNKNKATLFIPAYSYGNYGGKTGWKFMDIEECDTFEEFIDGGMKYVGWQLGTQKQAKLMSGKSIAMIPETAKSQLSSVTYNVIAIGESAFSGVRFGDNISLTIPEGIKRIEANALKNCSDLQTISLSSSLEVIGASAFQSCTGLKLITLPANLTTIGDRAFYGCSNLVEVESKTNSIVDITDKDVFSDEDMILYIPSTNTESEYKGKGWNFLHVFYGDRVPGENGDNTYVYGSAAYNTMILLKSKSTDTNVTIQHDVTVNGSSKKVTAIAKYAFLNNTSVNYLKLEPGITIIDKYAFKGCRNMIKVDLPSTLTMIRDYAFDGCTSINTINSAIVDPFPIEEHVFSPSIVPTIYIPSGSLKAYQTVEGWNRFENNYKLGAAVRGHDDNDDSMYYDYYTEDKTATLVKITGSNKIVNVPDTVIIGTKKYAVTAIGESLYKENTDNVASLQTLTISKGIKSIGANAFKGCTNLDNLTLPDGLVAIGKSAFENTKIVSQEIPNTVETIGAYAFRGCTSLQNITLPGSLRAIDDNAFEGDRKLLKLEVPKNVETIGNYAFRGCSGLTNVTLSDNLKTIGDNAFENNSSLSKLIIPQNVTSIGMSAFKGCRKLEWVDLPSKLEKIDQYAFENCTNITTVISRLDSKIIDIDDNVFTSIYDKATLFVPMPADSADAYDNSTIQLYRLANGWKNFITIIGGEKKISQPLNNKTYEYLTGPKTATLIDATNVVDMDVTIDGIVSIENVDYTVKTVAESAFKNNLNKSKFAKLTIKEGVQRIEPNAFANFSALTTLSLPTSLRYIGDNAFKGNGSLENLEIPELVDTMSIGMYAFSGCSKINKIQLPSTLTKIGDYAFNNCNNVYDIINKARTPFAISDNVFSSYTAAMYVPIGSKETYQKTAGWKNFKTIYEGERKVYTHDSLGMSFICATGDKTAILTKITTTRQNVIVPDSFLVEAGASYYKVVAIDKSVCNNNASMESLKIPENVKTIGANAFSNCSKLNMVWLPSALQEIGERAFENCRAINHFCIKVESVFQINPNVFSDYSKPTLYVPTGTKAKYNATGGWEKFTNVVEGYLVDNPTVNDITYIRIRHGEGSSASGTAILTKSATTTPDVVIPDTIKLKTDDISYKVKTISESAFINNTKLVNLTIREFVDSIGPKAFNGCNNIAYIISKVKKPFTINDNVFSITTPTLYVPVGSRVDYKNTDGWKKFTTIYEGEKKDTSVVDNGTEFSYECATGDKIAILRGVTTTEEVVTIPESFALDGSTYYKVIAIGKSALKNKSSIKHLTIPSTIEKIGDKAFEGCNNVEDIVNKLIEPVAINENVFSKYTAAMYVPIGSRIKYEKADGWKNFKTIYEGEKKDTSVVYSGTEFYYECATGDKTAILTGVNTTEKIVAIPDSFAMNDSTYYKVIAIGKAAFKNGSSIRNLTLPATLTKIGEKAFDGCTNLAVMVSKIVNDSVIYNNVVSMPKVSLYVPEGTFDIYTKAGWNFAYIYEGDRLEATVDGLHYVCATGDKTAILVRSELKAENAKNITIPGTISVGDDKFRVIAVNDTVFKGNADIERLTISEGIEKIGANAFQGCANLKKIELPASLTTIGERAFDGCKLATYICTKATTPIDIKENVFSSYNSASLFVPEGTLDSYKEATGWKKFSNYVEGYFVDDLTLNDMVFNLIIKGEGESKMNTAILTKSATVTSDVVIPESVELNNVKYIVSTIANSAFSNNSRLVNITISESLTEIGTGAFQGCSNLKIVTLPSTLTKIGDKAFDGCIRLAHITNRAITPIKIADSNEVFSTSIYETARLYVPSGSKTDYMAAEVWKKFTNILVGEMKEVTNDSLTFYCIKGPNVASVVKATKTAAVFTVPAIVKDGKDIYAVTGIEPYAFMGINTLEKLTISDNVTTIGVGAFQNCGNLKEVVIPKKVTVIGEKAFEKCNRLTLVVSRIEKPFAISNDVFPAVSAKLSVPLGTADLYRKTDGWGNFAMIYEGEMKETEIDGMKYAYTTGDRTAKLLKGSRTKEKELTIPSTISVDGVEYSVKTIGESALANASSVQILIVSEGISVIESDAFTNCANINKVSLPSTLTKIGDNAFSRCDKIVHIEASMKLPFDISENVFTETTYANATLYVPVNAADRYAAAEGWNGFMSMVEGSITEVKIEGMTYVCVPQQKIAKLTKGLADAKEVKIPSKIYTGGVSYYVVDIERSSFYGFNTLEKVVIPDSVRTIGMEAFKNCSKLNTVELPLALVSIGEKAFENCSKLSLIVCASETPATIFENTFPVHAITIGVPLGAKDVYMNAPYWGNENYSFFDSMSSVSEGDETEEVPGIYQVLTNDNNMATSVAIVDDVDVIGDFAIPETVVHNGVEYPVTAIAPSTFEKNVGLTSVTIPNSIDFIGEYAFAGCSNLKSITVNWSEPIDLATPASVRGLQTRSDGNSVFEGVDKATCILYVPNGSVEAYKAAEVWKEFQIIKPISETGINGIVNDGISFDVYDLQGRKVRQNVTTLKGLPSGIYIVNGKKIAIR